jgi:hypothetical protein
MAVWIGFVVLWAASLLAFWRLPPRTAAFGVLLGGWLFAPVGLFPSGSADAVHPYWITGAAVPSDMLVHKAWIVPLAVLVGAAVFDLDRLRRIRPTWFDAPVAAWCLWPIVQGTWIEGADPAPLTSAAYLAGTWGATWLIGRLYCTRHDDLLALARGLALSVIALLPFALVEGLLGLQTYGWWFGDHPFRNDGFERYFGWRPLGLFENGNQYGLWVSLCALVALWLGFARNAQRPWRAVALLALAVALAAQSVGALLLAGLGAVALALLSRVRPRALLVGAAALSLALALVYVSGAVPVVRIAKETAVGRAVVDTFKAVGRGSFTWRVARDQQALDQVQANLVTGSARWDWWREQQSRPWGLAMLLLGQFGLIGVLLAFGTLSAPAARVAWCAPRGDPLVDPALPLLMALVVMLALADALMNSFFFFPALAIAGGLTSLPQQAALRPRGEILRVPKREAAQ